MLDELLVHPRTCRQLQQFIAKPSHGLVLVGPEGSGKRNIAKAVAAELLHVSHLQLSNYPYYTVTDPTDATITIDDIRALQKLLTLRTPGNLQDIKRIMTVIDANRMRFEAQNAFLKSLEEPPLDTCIIMTAELNGDILSTIFSRMQRIDVLPVSETMAREYYAKKGISSVDIAKNYALSQGQVGLLDSLLHTETEHPLKTWVISAKLLLAKQPGERLLEVEVLSKDKNEVALLVNALGRIVQAALSQASLNDNLQAVKRWQDSLQAILEARENIDTNVNTKLLLDHLLLSI